MEENTQQDIRRLLKGFGIQADEAVMAYLAQNPHMRPLKVRLMLQDITDYGEFPPAQPLSVEVEGEIRPFSA